MYLKESWRREYWLVHKHNKKEYTSWAAKFSHQYFSDEIFTSFAVFRTTMLFGENQLSLSATTHFHSYHMNITNNLASECWANQHSVDTMRRKLRLYWHVKFSFWIFYWTFRCFSFLFWCVYAKFDLWMGRKIGIERKQTLFLFFLLAFFTHHHNPIRHLHCVSRARELSVELESRSLSSHHTECIVAPETEEKIIFPCRFKWMFESVQTYGKISWVNLMGGGRELE